MESSSFICVLILKLSLQQSILYPNLHRQEGMLPLLLSDFSRPTLCDPIDGSPPGSPIPEILQARTLEWVAISFSNAWKWKVKVKSLSCVQLLATPWTACSLPGSSVHGIFQARVLEWGAIAFSKASLVNPLSLLNQCNTGRNGSPRESKDLNSTQFSIFLPHINHFKRPCTEDLATLKTPFVSKH